MSATMERAPFRVLAHQAGPAEWIISGYGGSPYKDSRCLVADRESAWCGPSLLWLKISDELARSSVAISGEERRFGARPIGRRTRRRDESLTADHGQTERQQGWWGLACPWRQAQSFCLGPARDPTKRVGSPPLVPSRTCQRPETHRSVLGRDEGSGGGLCLGRHDAGLGRCGQAHAGVPGAWADRQGEW